MTTTASDTPQASPDNPRSGRRCGPRSCGPGAGGPPWARMAAFAADWQRAPVNIEETEEA